MRYQFSTLALAAALLSNSTAHAAQDFGLAPVTAVERDSPRGSVGAQLGLTIKFGNRATVRDHDRVQIGFAAGPVLSLNHRTADARSQRKIANVVGFAIRPGYSASATLVGQPVLTHRTLLGAAEDARNADGKGGGPSTLGWIGIGLGATVVVLGVAALALEDALDCTENGEYVCE
jgi:hypothetical protein